MKNLFKNKKFIVIASSALAVVLIAVTVISLTLPKNTTPAESEEPSVSETEKDITIEKPVESEPESSELSVGEIEDDGNALKPDESVDGAPAKNTGSKAETNEAEQQVAAEPANEPANNDEGSGIQIGGNPPVEESYNCGCANHHCQNAEYHAGLLNRELDGCPYCGSHSCPSFYAVNEWGFTIYDETLCPQYNEQGGSTKYCPDCGRPMWSVDNPTGCFRYLQDTQCECGELVPGNTCHHH